MPRRPNPLGVEDERPPVTVAGEADPSDGSDAFDAAVLAGRRTIAESIRDVLALTARGKDTKAFTLAQVAKPDHLLRLFKRRHQRTPSIADVAVICLISKVLESGRGTVSAFKEIADRLEGTPRQTVTLTAEVKRVSAEPMSLEEWSQKAIRALPSASPQ